MRIVPQWRSFLERGFKFLLKLDLKGLAAHLDKVDALGTGVNLLHGTETASGTHLMTEAVEHGNVHALGTANDDIVVRGSVNREVEIVLEFRSNCHALARSISGICSAINCATARRARCFAAGRRFRARTFASDNDIACIRDGIKDSIATFNLGFELGTRLGDFGLGKARLDLQSKRIVIIGNVVLNIMRQLNGSGAAAGGCRNLRGLAFLDIHGDMAHRGNPDILVILLSAKPLVLPWNPCVRNATQPPC